MTVVRAWVHRDTFVDTLKRYGFATVFLEDRTNLEPDIGVTVAVSIVLDDVATEPSSLPQKKDRRRKPRTPER